MRTLEKARQVLPPPMSPKDIEMARVAQRCIIEALDHSRAAAITLTTDAGELPSVEVPPAALRLIGQLLGAMSEGRPIAFVPSSQQFSTVEAAHFLNVSRPFLIKEIEAGCRTGWSARTGAWPSRTSWPTPGRCVSGRRARWNDLPRTLAIWGWTTEVAGHACYTALLDACVLYPLAMTDALMSLATAGLYAAKRTTRIVTEWIAALEERRPDLTGRLSFRRVRCAQPFPTGKSRRQLGRHLRAAFVCLTRTPSTGSRRRWQDTPTASSRRI